MKLNIPATPAASGTLVLGSIIFLDGEATVEGRIGGVAFTADVSPSALQTFQKFQAAIFAAVGMWPADPGYRRSPLARELWQNDVANAINAGDGQ